MRALGVFSLVTKLPLSGSDTSLNELNACDSQDHVVSSMMVQLTAGGGVDCA